MFIFELIEIDGVGITVVCGIVQIVWGVCIVFAANIVLMDNIVGGSAGILRQRGLSGFHKLYHKRKR